MTIDKKIQRSDIPGHHGLGGMRPEDIRRMAIGRGISMTGEISSCDCLVVEGTADITGLQAERLEICSHGRLSGDATVETAIIAGRFDGRLTVRGQLTLRAGAHVTGEVTYGAFEAESGATIEARIAAIPAEVKKPVTAPAPVVQLKTVEAAQPAEEDGATEEMPESTGIFRKAAGL